MTSWTSGGELWSGCGSDTEMLYVEECAQRSFERQKLLLSQPYYSNYDVEQKDACYDIWVRRNFNPRVRSEWCLTAVCSFLIEWKNLLFSAEDEVHYCPTKCQHCYTFRRLLELHYTQRHHTCCRTTLLLLYNCRAAFWLVGLNGWREEEEESGGE